MSTTPDGSTPRKPVSGQPPMAQPLPGPQPGQNQPVPRPQPVPQPARPQPIPQPVPQQAAARPIPAGQAPAGARPAPQKIARPIPIDKSKAKLVRDDDVPEEANEPTEQALKAAPPWLISTVVHVVILLALALLYFAADPPQLINLDAVYAEDIGEQLEDDVLQMANDDLLTETDPIMSLDMTPVEDPLAAPPDLEPILEGVDSTSQITAPSVGIALTGREKGMKQALLAKYGGTATTEAAVLMGLEWLKRNQGKDGSWSLMGPYSNGGFNENKTAATAMALLAFQGAGNTHKEGKFKAQVANGWKFLIAQQDRDGNFFHNGVNNHRLYSQAQATIAICELYGMTRDAELREPAQRSINYALSIQAPEGGWRYTPRSDSDTSVTGWFVMALQSAIMAGLEVPSDVWDEITNYLNSVAVSDGSRYRYQPNRAGESLAMTAEGLLCRQYIGWRQSDERLVSGANYVVGSPIEWSRKNAYYWYYATQLMHHMEGDLWDKWNRSMRQVLPENQTKTGPEHGSWSPAGDRWGNHGGRLYMTCLCIFNLEVYYRHLPIYSYRVDR